MSGRLAALAAAGLCVGVFTVYALVMGSLFAIRAGVTVELPWWLAVAAPVALYAMLAGAALPRATASMRAAAFGALCAAHVVVAGVTAVLVAAVTDVSVAAALAAASLSFMPAPLLQLLAVPLMLWPLRALLRMRRRTGARRPEAEFEWARPRGGTVPNWQGGRPLPGPARAAEPPAREASGGRPTPPAATGPRTSAFSSPPRMPAPVAPPAAAPTAPSPARGVFVLGAPLDEATVDTPSAPSRVTSAFAPPAVESPAGGAAVPVAAGGSVVDATSHGPAPRAADPIAPSREAPEPTASAAVAREGAPPAAAAGPAARPSKPEGNAIPVSFDRVATALPADLLAWDPSRISAGLAEPGVILVPVAVVLPQLAEGFAAIEWAEVLPQFPAGAFRGDATEVAGRLPDGRLPLPLDEIVQRLPQEMFAAAGPEADLGALESYPLPFQPVDAAPPLPAPPVPARAPEPMPVPRVEAASDASPADAHAVEVHGERPLDAPAVAATSAVSSVDSRAVQVERSPVWENAPAVSPPAAAEAPAAKLEAASSPSDTPAAKTPSDVSPADVPVRVERGPTWAEALDRPAASGVSPAEPPAAKVDVPTAPVHGSVAEMDTRPLARLAHALAPVGSLFGSEVERDGRTVYVFRPPSVEAEAVLAAAGPALALLRSHAGRLGQLTVRAERGAIVLTSLSEPEDAALVLAAAPLDGSLALLEILSQRISASRTVPVADPASDAGLEPVSAGPAADLVAGGLTAFGALTPSVVRDPAGRVELCVLHAAGEGIRELATVAHAACCALAAADPGALGPVRDAVLRLSTGAPGARRVAVRPVGGRPGHWIALAAPSGDARPGLVELEIARAAARVAR